MEMVKVSPLPVGPLSVTSATKVQGAPLFVQVPATMAELPLISSELSITLRASPRLFACRYTAVRRGEGPLRVA